MLSVHNSCSERQNSRTWKNSTTSTSYYRKLAAQNCQHLTVLCTQGPTLSPRDRDEKILLETSRVPPTTTAAQLNPQGALQPVRKSKNKSKLKSSKCEDSAALNSCCVQRASRSSGSDTLHNHSCSSHTDHLEVCIAESMTMSRY